jgi:hypothetical protein
MAIQKKSLISSRTPEKKAATKQDTSVGEPKTLTAKALSGRSLRIASKRAQAHSMRSLARR